VDKIGCSPLHLAAREDRSDVVELLLANKAAIDARSNKGWTPLHYAAANDHIAVVKLLLAAGADVNAVAGGLRETPLRMAVEYEHKGVAQWLRQHGGHE
jgi:ankyrin repeat protein